tara:strand:- start:757 stop:999 length:243 start_codon:yes stop_codon:yes gene_type:complete
MERKEDLINKTEKMNEAALMKMKSKVMVLDNELLKYINYLLFSDSDLSDDQLKIVIESKERELKIYDYIIRLLIANQNRN